MTPIDKAIQFFGTQQALADAIGASQAQVSHWRLGLKRVPAKRAKKIDEVTNGYVKKEELCPDIFGDTAA